MLRGSVTHTLRKSELLGVSITEILFILIFVLLAFTYFAEREKKVEIDLKNKEINSLREAVTTLKTDLANVRSKNSDLRAEIEKWKENYNTLIAVIAKYVSDAGTLTPREVADNLESILFAAGKAGGDKAVAAELARLKKENRELKSEIEDLEKKIAELERVQQGTSGGGLDKPRCVVKGYPGVIDYLFEVTMYPSSYTVRALWDERYDSVFAVIPGIREFGRTNSLSNPDFITAANKIYKWGDTQSPRCRFYVEVLNNMGDVRSSIYQRQFGTVENRFYILKKGWK